MLQGRGTPRQGGGALHVALDNLEDGSGGELCLQVPAESTNEGWMVQPNVVPSAHRKVARGRSRSATTLSLHDLPYAVVDLETTGFSPVLGDRIVEVAILKITEDGTVQDEWDTLVNPLRDVGPTHVHGITAEDVAEAPTFTEIVGDVLERLDRAILVAHNARFDHDFRAAELSMAGVFLPAIPCRCTLTFTRMPEAFGDLFGIVKGTETLITPATCPFTNQSLHRPRTGRSGSSLLETRVKAPGS